MPARFKKKVRKMRGKKWHGWGGKKKHRGGGSRGGRGKAGLRGIKKSYMLVYEPEHFVKKGFHIPPSLARAKAVRCINLKNLEELAEKENLKEIDLSKFGYQKLLGNGKITKPLTIKVKFVTKLAKSRIEAAGGRVVS